MLRYVIFVNWRLDSIIQNIDGDVHQWSGIYPVFSGGEFSISDEDLSS